MKFPDGLFKTGKWRGQGLAVGETLAGPRSASLSLGEHFVGLLCQLPCGFALFSLLSLSQGLLLDFCLQSFGEEPLTSLYVQGSSAFTSLLFCLKKCESREEVSVALSNCWTGLDFVKSKSVNSKWCKLNIWCQVACPSHLGILPAGVKWILFCQPCVSCITFPQDRIHLVLEALGEGEAAAEVERIPQLHGLSVVGDMCEGFLDRCKFWICISVSVFCLHALLQSTVAAAVDPSYAAASAGAD